MSDIEKRAIELLDKHCPPGDYDYSDILDAIREALTPQWQPIQTAPKNRSDFLVGEFYFSDVTYVYKEFSTAWRDENGTIFCRDENVVPTHWMPLPTPPNV